MTYDLRAFPLAIPDLGDPEANAKMMRDHGWAGMLLRDYFAAAALPSAIERVVDAIKSKGGIEPQSDLNIPLSMARMAYEIADAMLEARKS